MTLQHICCIYIYIYICAGVFACRGLFCRVSYFWLFLAIFGVLEALEAAREREREKKKKRYIERERRNKKTKRKKHKKKEKMKKKKKKKEENIRKKNI